MEANDKTGGVSIERGRIVQAQGGLYVVESYTRGGVETRPMEAVNQYVNEDTKYEYKAGDEVDYFMFGDGRGLILGGMRRE